MKENRLTGTRTGKAVLTLVVLALLGVALQSLVFSGASFTAAASNASSTFTAGSLSHVNSMADQVTLDAAGLRPGTSSSGTLTITGGGDVAGVYSVSKASVGDTPASPGLSNSLTLTIEDVTGTATTLYSGTVAGFTSVDAGTIATGQTRTYRFTLTYPLAAADPDLQGAAMELRIAFTGVSS